MAELEDLTPEELEKEEARANNDVAKLVSPEKLARLREKGVDV